MINQFEGLFIRTSKQFQMTPIHSNKIRNDKLLKQVDLIDFFSANRRQSGEILDDLWLSAAVRSGDWSTAN